MAGSVSTLPFRRLPYRSVEPNANTQLLPGTAPHPATINEILEVEKRIGEKVRDIIYGTALNPGAGRTNINSHGLTL